MHSLKNEDPPSQTSLPVEPPSWCIGQNGITGMTVPPRGKWDHYNCPLQVRNSLGWDFVHDGEGRNGGRWASADSFCATGPSNALSLTANPYMCEQSSFLTNSEGHCLVIGTATQHFQRRSGAWHRNFSAVAKSYHKYCIEGTKSWKIGNRKIWGQGQFPILNPQW